MGRRWREFGVGFEVDYGPAVETGGVLGESEVDDAFGQGAVFEGKQDRRLAPDIRSAGAGSNIRC